MLAAIFSSSSDIAGLVSTPSKARITTTENFPIKPFPTTAMTAQRLVELPKCAGEVQHAGIDFKPLLEKLHEIGDGDPATVIAFAAKHAPGSANLGLIEAGNQDINLLNRCETALLGYMSHGTNRGKSGFQMGLNHISPTIFKDIAYKLLLNSESLTPDKIANVKATIRAKGGCTIYMAQQTYRPPDGSTAGCHAEVIVVFNDKKDGDPLCFSLVKETSDTEKNAMTRRLIQRATGCDNINPRKPEGDLAKAFASPEGTGALAEDNVLLVLRRPEWYATLAEYLVRGKFPTLETEPDHPLPFVNHPTETMIAFDGDANASSYFLQVEEYSKICIADGALPTYGRQAGGYCCFDHAKDLIEGAMPGTFKDVGRHFIPAKQVTEDTIAAGARFYRARKADARINEFDNAGVFEEVTADEARQHIKKVWQDKNMDRQITPGMQSWANMYDHFQTSHSDPSAISFYVTVALAATYLFEAMADELVSAGEINDDDIDVGTQALLAKLKLEGLPANLDFGLEDADWDEYMGKLLEKPDVDRLSEKHQENAEALLLSFFEGATPEDDNARDFDPLAANAFANIERPSPEAAGDFVVQQLTNLAQRLILEATADIGDAVEPDLAGTFPQREKAYGAMGIIAQRHFPGQAKQIKALLWLIFSDTARIGLGLTFFWQIFRYITSHDGGRTAPLGPEVGGVILFCMFMPILDTAVDHIAMKNGGLIRRPRQLSYPMRLFQQIPQAVIGGHIVGYPTAAMPETPPDTPAIVRDLTDWGKIMPGLIAVSTVNYVLDRYLYHQEFDHLEMDEPNRVVARKALSQMRRDLLTIRHWLTVRGPLVVALGLHRNSTQFWYNIFQQIDNPVAKKLLGGTQFATFYTSVVIFTMLFGLRYDIDDPRLLKLLPWFFKNKLPSTDAPTLDA